MKETCQDLIKRQSLQQAGRKGQVNNIQSNMFFSKATNEIKHDNLLRKLAAIFSRGEVEWNVLQQKRVKKRIEEKLKKNLKSKDYT